MMAQSVGFFSRGVRSAFSLSFYLSVLGTNKNMKVSGRSAWEKVKECGKGHRFRNNQLAILS